MGLFGMAGIHWCVSKMHIHSYSYILTDSDIFEMDMLLLVYCAFFLLKIIIIIKVTIYDSAQIILII